MTHNSLGNTIVTGVLVLVALIGGFILAGGSKDTALQGVHEVRDWYPNGITTGKAAVADNWAVKELTEGQDQAVLITNDTSKNMYVSYGAVELITNAAGNSTASSTMNVRMFATSTSEVPNSHDFTTIAADKYQLVIGNWATSTTATTTNSVGTVSAGAQGSIILPAGWSLVAYVNKQWTGLSCSGSVCETATSSNRGFNIRAWARYQFLDTAVK